MFKWFKGLWNEPVLTTKTSLNMKVMELPTNGLSPLVKHYQGKGEDKIPVVLVAIYNTDQLAAEIAKHLKDSTDNSGKGDNDGK